MQKYVENDLALYIDEMEKQIQFLSKVSGDGSNKKFPTKADFCMTLKEKGFTLTISREGQVIGANDDNSEGRAMYAR